MNSPESPRNDAMPPRHRVVVTGLGALTCVGNSAASMWNSLINARSGIRTIETFDTRGLALDIGGEVRGFDPAQTLQREWSDRLERFSQFSLAVGLEALHHAGYDPDAQPLPDAAVFVGNGHGTNLPYKDEVVGSACGDPHWATPALLPRILYYNASATLARRIGAAGPRCVICSACASGSLAIERAWRCIRRGAAPMALAVGTEANLDPFGIRFLGGMRALASLCPDPAQASRPFDRARSGFVLAEGAAALVLESLDHARQRGAEILAELRGCGGAANAESLYDPQSAGPAGAMRLALRNAQVAPDAVDAVFAHATATPLGDPAEIEAIRLALGPAAARTFITAPKSLLGHAIAASGSLGAVQCVMAIRTGVIPPTINCDDPDDFVAGLNIVRNVAAQCNVRTALCNAFGFGGANAAAVFARFTG